MASLDIGIDLGTSNMIAGNRKDGIIVREPTILAINEKTGKVLGVGEKVSGMIGREHSHMKVIFPMENGVISDYRMTQELARFIFKSAGKSVFFKPRVIACIPCSTTDLEAQSMIDTMEDAGARQVLLMKEPVAAAYGAGMDLSQAHGKMIMDIGGGTTDIAVLSLGGVVASSSSLYAGNAIDDAIEKHLRSMHQIFVGKQTAQQVKIQLASLWEEDEDEEMEIKGRGSVTGLPTRIILKRSDLYPVLREISDGIVQCAQRTLEITPPELAGDLIANGLTLTGGGALMRGVQPMLQQRLRVPVHIAEQPLDCAVLGTLSAFDYWDKDFDGFFFPKASYHT